MKFNSPGFADQLDDEMLGFWNQEIQAEYSRLEPKHGSRFFTLDPDTLPVSQPAKIEWFGSPAEPEFCMGSQVAQQLSDWGIRGRHSLHNEYCEYTVIYRTDPTGQLRPKRVEVTTELREYWLTLAKYKPLLMREIMAQIVGFTPSWEDLYGTSDPNSLTREQRETLFSRYVAGTDSAQPLGRINTEHALFMTHPINGLDDLLYIVMFGAKPYVQQNANGEFIPATREQIFREFGVEHLACRHADPAAAMGAHGAAFQGASVAFANPLGMYIQTFNSDVFFYNDAPLPQEWVRFGRGRAQGLYQRLEFGPSDDEPVFLDDIRVAVGSGDIALLGGYQVVEKIEVGPQIIASPASMVQPDEYILLANSVDPIQCSEASVCRGISNLKEAYDREQQMAVVAPRVMNRVE